MGALLPELYLRDLAQGNFKLALRGLLGEGAPLSRSSVQRLKAQWEAKHARWRGRNLSCCELVYLWADGLYGKAGLEKNEAPRLIDPGVGRVRPRRSWRGTAGSWSRQTPGGVSCGFCWR